MTINQIATDYRKHYIVVVATKSRTHVAVPQHGPLSLYAKLENPSLGEIGALISHWTIFTGPQILHGPGSSGPCGESGPIYILNHQPLTLIRMAASTAFNLNPKQTPSHSSCRYLNYLTKPYVL